MGALGEHDPSRTEGPTGFLSTRLVEDLQRFQSANGLKVDGIVDPRGETLGRVKQVLTKKLGPAALKPQRRKPAGSSMHSSSATGSLLGKKGKDPFAGIDLPEGPEAGANLIPTQSTGRPPGSGSNGQPSAGANFTREEFLKKSRDSERKRKRDLEGDFHKASHESERRLPQQVKELDRKYRHLLRLARIGELIAPNESPRRAINAFERYLDGKGGTVRYDPRWVRSQPAIKRGEDRVLAHFVDWLCGKPLKAGGPPPSVSANILKLKPAASFSDGTDRSAAALFGKPLPTDKFTDFFNLSKDSTIKGFGNFSFSRNGNTIRVTGTIEQNWRDTFDFAPGRTIHLPIKEVGVKVETDELIFLRGVGKARPFQLRSAWRRRVTGQIRVAKNPNTGKNEIVEVTLKWAD